MNIIKLISPGGVVRKWGIRALDNIREDIAYRKAKGLQSADLFQVGDQSYELIGGVCSGEYGYYVHVHPSWNGHDEIWECPDCGEELDFVEGEG